MVELLLSAGTNDAAIISGIFGVVGTVAGTFIGFLLTLLSRGGRRNIVCQSFELLYYYGDNLGVSVYKKENNYGGNSPQKTKITLNLLITNSSEMPFNINLAKLIIRQDDKTFYGSLSDKNDSKCINGLFTSERIMAKQIGVKSSIYLELYTQFNEVYVYKEPDSFYIEYIDVKGRTIQKKIKMVETHETEI